MRRLFQRFRGYLPRRRQRAWRYVSGRRRGVGLVLFASLLLLGYLHWFLTNDARMKRQVVRYLARRTGGRVELARARFSLFEGIRVTRLRVYLSDRFEEPFFEAREVLLKHRPSGLLLRGRLEPTELVCVGPRVTLVEDVATGTQNVSALFRAAARARRTGTTPEELPAIRLRDGELVRKDLEGGSVVPAGRWEDINVALLPVPGKPLYTLNLEGPGEAGSIVRVSGTINMATGETHVDGLIGLKKLDDALPRRYRQWCRTHKLTGSVTWSGRTRVGAFPSTAPARDDHLAVRLVNVGMELPPEEGGVRLKRVKGDLLFDRLGIDVANLTGALADDPKATFRLNGRYHGYDPTSPFAIAVEIPALQLPFRAKLTGAWGRSYARLNERLAPAGPVAVRATIRRDDRRRITIDGSAELRGVSLRLPTWPIRVEDVKGTVLLEGDRLKLADLRGRLGEAEVTIAGRLGGTQKDPDYDITLSARNVPLTGEVRDALPKRQRKVWDLFSPQGKADCEVRLRRGRGQRKCSVTVAIRLTGAASAEYRYFPYRVDRIEGQVLLTAGGAELRSVRGAAGPMRFVLNGRVLYRGRHPDVELFVDATDVPLDEKLARAMRPEGRAAYEACGLSGRAHVAKAVIRRRAGGPVDFEIPVALTDAGILHRRFPYRIEHVRGSLKLTRRGVDIAHLVGRHAQGSISVSGKVRMAKGREDVDLAVEAGGLELDSELRDALPPKARWLWGLLEPGGTADATLTLRGAVGQAGPAAAKRPAPQAEYRLVVRPRDARIRYRHFPYMLRRLTGEVEIVPGEMRLKALTALTGEGRVTLDGTVTTDEGGEQADLRLTTGPVPIDKQLIAALPPALVKTLQLRPGGTAALDLKSLKIRGAHSPATAPAADARPGAGADRAGGAPATRPVRPTAWTWAGRLDLTDAVVGLGVDAREVTGSIEGTLGCPGPPERLFADARVRLDKLRVGPHRLTRVAAELHKAEESGVLKIDDLSAEAYKGRVAGFAKVRLAEPAKYELSLAVQNIDLAELLKVGRGGGPGALDLKGLLDGNLQMTATAGDDSSRLATGRLRITQAKIYRLPVLLGFLHLIYLTLPSDSAFHTAQVSYYLIGSRLVFREIHLLGSALSMLGAGNVDLKTERLKLTFLTGPPRKLPPMPALSGVLNSIAGGLMTVRVTGTLSRPRRRAVPFRNPRDTLEELYNPDGR